MILLTYFSINIDKNRKIILFRVIRYRLIKSKNLKDSFLILIIKSKFFNLRNFIKIIHSWNALVTE